MEAKEVASWEMYNTSCCSDSDNLSNAAISIRSLCRWPIIFLYQSDVSSSTLNYVPSSPGSHTVDVSAYNEITFPQNGETINIYSNEVVATITVNSALSTPSASATPSTVNQSQSSTLSVTGLSGGTTPHSYQWLQKAPGAGSYSAIPGATSSTYVFSTSSSTASGTWSFEVNVTDSASSPVTVTSNAASVTVNILPKVVAPMFNPSGGTYTSSQSVTLSCGTSGATVRYTLDGSEPTSLSTAYTAPLLVNSNVTITAKAFKTGMAYSDTVSATYTFVSVVPEFPTVTANILVLAFLTLILLFTKRTYGNNTNSGIEQRGDSRTARSDICTRKTMSLKKAYKVWK